MGGSGEKADASISEVLVEFCWAEIQVRVKSVTMTKAYTAEVSGFEFTVAPWLKAYLCQAYNSVLKG